jgi:hypothetical protein
MPTQFFSDRGPLVDELQTSQHRYVLSWGALNWSRSYSALDWQHRLYGLTNLPFHLSAAGNFGEPLVPELNYHYMDMLYRQASLDDAAPYLMWADVSSLFIHKRLPSHRLEYDGQNLWERYRVPGRLSRALWFNSVEGAMIPADLVVQKMPPINHGIPLIVDREREDRFSVKGKTNAGWVYLAEPKISGWKTYIHGQRIFSEPAFGPFQRFKVPSGEWVLHFRYWPASWALGLFTTCLILFGSAAYWYNRFRMNKGFQNL